MWGMALAVPIAFLLFIQAVWYLMFGTITPYTECFFCDLKHNIRGFFTYFGAAIFTLVVGLVIFWMQNKRFPRLSQPKEFDQKHD